MASHLVRNSAIKRADAQSGFFSGLKKFTVSKMIGARASGIAGLLALSLFLLPPAVFATRDDVVRLNNDGVNALKTNNYMLAIQKFEAALKIDSTYKLARENLAIAYN